MQMINIEIDERIKAVCPEMAIGMVRAHVVNSETSDALWSEIEQAADETVRRMQNADSPVIGLHLEGPYLNPSMAGGQMPEYIRKPDPKEYRMLVDRYPCIRRWDAAPEMEGALEFGKYLSLLFGVTVFILCGTEHCVADMYYFSIAGMWNPHTLLCLIVITLGNAFGGVLFPLMRRLRK